VAVALVTEAHLVATVCLCAHPGDAVARLVCSQAVRLPINHLLQRCRLPPHGCSQPCEGLIPAILAPAVMNCDHIFAQ
jgi:hypothetical protein